MPEMLYLRPEAYADPPGELGAPSGGMLPVMFRGTPSSGEGTPGQQSRIRAWDDFKNDSYNDKFKQQQKIKTK